MKRPSKKAPDPRCHGVAVLRDVAPHKIPVRAGRQVLDLDADLVGCMELVAKTRGTTFAAEFDNALRHAIEKGYGKELGQ